ncbi:DUF155-domain-containing protein [Coprinellus micaceus]|uniref:DUF155-domain-containing protein n=1 Tax=Coprinellus micaceus TaxID=71717 RepID=A0A4Y7TK72_COPMI|nr:DUF155-domain-containing protein [Coprinellus micaceus]
MASLPKHQRTTKTSQKLVVLPSAPQTKPLAKQLVLLDEEQETSDDATHPHGMLPPKRPQKRTSAKGRIPRSRVQEPESEETQEDPSHPSKMRIRDYKSLAERMTKEERKKEGYKRITAYCIGEGLKMKDLAGFLKREHNVLPRVFDEAMYAMYHLPLLPGYGPQTNVRSSAPPAPPIPTEGSGAAFTKSILTRLEEAEEDGYQGAYFPSEQDLINLEERTDSAALAGDVNRHSDPDSRLPGLVQAGTVDEVREYDGYVTSSSLPRQAENGRVEEGTGDEFTYEYNPYPSESSSPTSTVHKPAHYEQSDLLSAAGPYYTDSGVETDDPGAQTDPGIYGRSSSPIPLTAKAKGDGLSPSDGDMTASIMTAVPIPITRDLVGEGVTDDEAERPRFIRAATLPVVEGIAVSAEEPSPLVQDELYGEDQSTRSAYERQMGYDREKESHAEKERERLVRIAYEEALEREREREREQQLDNVGEVVFFDYGVVVFFGLAEPHERDILEDIEEAGIVRRLIPEDEWEIEECHFAHDPKISYPRIYNDFFTLKSRSHLLKLSIAHALAQSTLLARYETIAQRTLSSPLTLAIPRQMASTGALQLRRHEALKLTGRLFKLRRDVNLVSNVLDVPELFWSEASLEDLYDAVRDYMEIGPRVESLNEKLGVASDFVSRTQCLDVQN